MDPICSSSISILGLMTPADERKASAKLLKGRLHKVKAVQLQDGEDCI